MWRSFLLVIPATLLLLIYSNISIPRVHARKQSAFEAFNQDTEESINNSQDDILNDESSDMYSEMISDFYRDLSPETDIKVAADISDLKLFVRPEKLVYKDRPISIAVTEEFQIVNGLDEGVHIYSVTSDKQQFRPVMFEAQDIPPKQTMVVQLLFLPYILEPISATVTIITSVGEYKYPVEGHAIPNPYRIQPFLGNKFSVGSSTFEKSIILYNPYDEPLHIKEVFCTEEFLSLKGASIKDIQAHTLQQQQKEQIRLANKSMSDEDKIMGVSPFIDSGPDLSDAKSSGVALSPSGIFSPGKMWEVPPLSSKEVIVLSVSAALDPGSYSGFVHIKTSKDSLVLPVEVDIVSGSVYSDAKVVDIGVLSGIADRKTKDLWLMNSGEHNVLVTEIRPVKADPNLVINSVLSPIVYAGPRVNSRVAVLSYSATRPGKVENTLLVFTNSSNPGAAVVEVRYKATVLHGGVGYEHHKTYFEVAVHNLSYTPLCSHCEAMLTASKWQSFHSDTKVSSTCYSGGRGGGSSSSSSSSRDKCQPETAAAADSGEIRRRLVLSNLYGEAVRLVGLSSSSCKNVLTVVLPPELATSVSVSSVDGDGSDSSVSSGASSSSSGVVSGVAAVAQSLQQWPAVELVLAARLVESFAARRRDYLPRTCWLDLSTNISMHRIPVQIFDGGLSIEFMDAVRSVPSK